MFATDPGINRAARSCALRAQPATEQEPRPPTSAPLSWATTAAGEGNAEDASQAPPAREMHFMALRSQFLLSDVPFACGDTDGGEETFRRLGGPHPSQPRPRHPAEP